MSSLSSSSSSSTSPSVVSDLDHDDVEHFSLNEFSSTDDHPNPNSFHESNPTHRYDAYQYNNHNNTNDNHLDENDNDNDTVDDDSQLHIPISPTSSSPSSPSLLSSSPLSFAYSFYHSIFHFPFLPYIFPLIFLTQLTFHLFLFSALPTTASFSSSPSTSKALSAIFLIPQVIAIVIATIQTLYLSLSHQLNHRHTLGIYLSMLFFYGYLYEFSYICNVSSSFTFPADDQTSGVFAYWVAFVYFSILTSTTTGFGDIVPSIWWTKCIAMSQMLVTIVYVVGVFSIGLAHFSMKGREEEMEKAERREMINNIENDHNGNENNINENESELVHQNDDDIVSHSSSSLRSPHTLIFRFFRSLRRDYIQLDRIRSFIYSFCLPLTLFIQLLLITILNLYDPLAFSHPYQDVLPILIVLLVEILQFIIIVFMSLSLVSQLSTKSVSPLFLLQSYCSVVVLFASVFVVIYLFAGPSSFHLVPINTNNSALTVPQTIGSFLWLSLVTITSTGYGDMYSLHVVARMVSMIEMLMGVFYNVVILGIGVTSMMGEIDKYVKPSEGVRRVLEIAGMGITQEIGGNQREEEKKEEKETKDDHKDEKSNVPSLSPSLDDSFHSSYPHLRHVETHHTVISEHTTYEEWTKIRKEMLKSMNDYQREIGELKKKVEKGEKENGSGGDQGGVPLIGNPNDGNKKGDEKKKEDLNFM